ncbi:MAG: hypothetical protein HYW22_00820 [Candidatus Aenigmarchaeota archaeon]|nr:hypothetical protein [Candidatus Aenigmarchaeota archaeon]
MLGLLISLAVVFLINIYLTYSILKPFNLSKTTSASILTTIVKNDCSDCYDMQKIVSQLKQVPNVKVTSENTVSFSSNEGKYLIDRYSITKLPALIITGEIDKSGLSSTIPANNGALVLSGLPPYYNISSGKVVGLVKVIYLNDTSCTKCYNVLTNKQILLNFGVGINNETTLDISSTEGKMLISKYNITRAPVIILSPEANVYNSLVQAWNSVGIIEPDGWFVMKDPSILGNYENITSS